MITAPINKLIAAAQPLAEVFRQLPGYYPEPPDTICDVKVRQGDVMALRQAIEEAKLERFELVFKDCRHDSQSWSWHVVLRNSGPLPKTEEATEDFNRDVLHFLEEREIVNIRCAGNGGAGRPFADAPWIQTFPDFIIVSQNGGLDI